MKAFLLITVTLKLLLCSVAFASENPYSNVRISGFGTVGITKGDNDNIGVRDTASHYSNFDEWSSTNITKLGLQLDYQFTDKLKAGLQIIAKERHVEDDISDAINWAYLDYQVTPKFGIRVGRMGQDLYMVSDHKEIGYTQLWAHAPIEFYGTLGDVKDGIQLRYQHPIADGFLVSKFTASKMQTMSLNSDTADIIKYKPNFDINLEWSNANWTARFTHSRGKVDEAKGSLNIIEQQVDALVGFGWTQLQPFVGEFTFDDTWIKYSAFGLSYRKYDWIVQAELNQIQTESIFFSKVKGGYLLVGKSLGNFTPYAIVAKAKSDRVKTPDAPAPFIAAREAIDILTGYLPVDQTTFSAGLRWDIKSNIALKVQWDRTWIDERGSYLFDVIQPQTESEKLDRFTLAVDFVF